MAVITPDRFDPIKAFCNVRLQQGVPLVDADVNELDDIRKFEVRAFLKWFVGDGVPEGNDGFRIAPFTLPGSTTPEADNFTIAAGMPTAPAGTSHIDKGLRHVGRCIVDGLDVIIERDTSYKRQPNVTEANVEPIPNAAGPVLVYLDVWEHLVKPSEDPEHLIVPPLGTETCARMKREWVVRTLSGTSVPEPSNGHSYYGLAIIQRRMESIDRPMPGRQPIPREQPMPIRQSDITDLREQKLLIPPSTLIPDVLGGTANDYRRGLNRPAISLRDAINAIARGEVPGLPEQPVNANQTEFPGRSTLDGSNGLVLSWGNSAQQIFVARLDFDNTAAGFASVQQISRYARSSAPCPSVVSVPGGDLIVAYIAGGNDICFKRGPTPAALATATEQKFSRGLVGSLFVVASNNIVVFFFELQAGYHYQRYDASTSASTSPWMDANPVPIPRAIRLSAAVDAAGNVWVAYMYSGGIETFSLNPTTGVKATATRSFPRAADNSYSCPFVLCGAGQVWAFWNGSDGIWFAKYSGTAWGDATRLPYTVAGDAAPKATFDAFNRIAVAYQRVLPPDHSITTIVLAYGDPTSDGWLPPTAAIVTSTRPGGDLLELNLREGGGIFSGAGSLWLYWSRYGSDDEDPSRLYYRQICCPL